MKQSNKWLEFAKRDLKDAEILFKSKRYFGSVYHCHQAIEKSLKAILVEREKEIPKTHDLLDLLNQTELSYPKEILEFLQKLNPYYTPIRYPDVPEAASLELRYQIAKEILKLTQETIKWLKSHLNQTR